jgi:hypothetical protein
VKRREDDGDGAERIVASGGCDFVPQRLDQSFAKRNPSLPVLT